MLWPCPEAERRAMTWTSVLPQTIHKHTLLKKHNIWNLLRIGFASWLIPSPAAASENFLCQQYSWQQWSTKRSDNFSHGICFKDMCHSRITHQQDRSSTPSYSFILLHTPSISFLVEGRTTHSHRMHWTANANPSFCTEWSGLQRDVSSPNHEGPLWTTMQD